MSECSAHGCNRPARMAIRTTRPTRSDLRITVFADDRAAPKAADPRCKEHGMALVASLINTVVDRDEEEANGLHLEAED